MRTLIKTVLFLLVFANSFAQECPYSLSGKITDKDNGEPLEYTIVSVKEIDFSTNTNEEGEFKIDNLCLGIYTLRIIHVGCTDTSIILNLSKNTRVNIKLPHSLHELADVEIIEKVDYKPTQTIDNIKQEEIDKAKGKTLADALKGSAGITTLNTGASISKPMIHGLQGYRILILNNGIRQEGQQWGNEHAPEIDPFVAKKISIVKVQPAFVMEVMQLLEQFY
ncbi:MAG: TonB-dependent receptor [Bacteroidia bacterium]